jgi:hypothetical protein
MASKAGPEAEVEKLIVKIAPSLGLSLDVIDSKASWNVAAKRFMKSRAAPEGFPDLVGCDLSGRAVFIELKAPGVKSIRPMQRAFLRKKIDCRAIAGVVRSVQELDNLLKFSQQEMLDWLESFKDSK